MADSHQPIVSMPLTPPLFDLDIKHLFEGRNKLADCAATNSQDSSRFSAAYNAIA